MAQRPDQYGGRPKGAKGARDEDEPRQPPSRPGWAWGEPPKKSSDAPPATEEGLAALARRVARLPSRDLPVDRTKTSMGPSPLQRRRLLGELRQQGTANVPGASMISQAKAKTILRETHPTVHGRPITTKQRGYFGLIAGGGTPRKAALR